MIDTHLHLWDTERFTYPWLDDEPRLPRPLTGRELDTRTTDGRRVVLVEAGVDPRDVEGEARWFARLAASHPKVHGFVAAVDLTREDLGTTLDALQALPGFVGVRHLWQDTTLLSSHPGPLGAALGELARREIAFDACVRAGQLPALHRLVESAPEATIVLDHLGKPPVGDPRGLDRWRADLARLAEVPGVHCKLSGLPAECRDAGELETHLAGIVAHAVGCFGPGRCLVGSDWPVSDPGFDWCARVVGMLPEQDRHAVAEANALTIYRRHR